MINLADSLGILWAPWWDTEPSKEQAHSSGCHQLSDRFFKGSWKELDVSRQRRENSECILLVS